jgi:hypothetical protein
MYIMKNTYIRMRISEGEKRLWQEYASREGLSLSGLIRESMRSFLVPEVVDVPDEKGLLEKLDVIHETLQSIDAGVHS